MALQHSFNATAKLNWWHNKSILTTHYQISDQLFCLRYHYTFSLKGQMCSYIHVHARSSTHGAPWMSYHALRARPRAALKCILEVKSASWLQTNTKKMYFKGCNNASMRTPRKFHTDILLFLMRRLDIQNTFRRNSPHVWKINRHVFFMINEFVIVITRFN